MDKPQKQYVNGVLIKKQDFNNGGSIIKLAIATEPSANGMGGLEVLTALIRANAKNGWCNLVIADLKQPKMSKDGTKIVATHCMYVDDYVPKQSSESAPDKSASNAPKYATSVPF
jgi:hypothetical protein